DAHSMNLQRHDAGKVLKIRVRGEHRHPSFQRRRADQEVSALACYADGAKLKINFSRAFMIGGRHRDVLKLPECVSKTLKLRHRARPAEQLLPDDADDAGPLLLEQPPKLIGDGQFPPREYL